jgi:sugar-specific transcriptional regulator TrmB
LNNEERKMLAIQPPPPSFKDSEIIDEKSVAAKLTTFGLTLNQARVYLFLLRAKNSNVRTISKELGLHRVEVYRKLKELEELGVIDVVISSPKSYVPLEPKIALRNLVSKEEERVIHLKQALPSLESELVAYQSLKGRQILILPEKQYRMAHGVNRYYSMVTKLIRSATREVLTVVSANGVKEIFRRGLTRDYQAAQKRGVNVHIISQVNNDNKNFVERLLKFSQFKALPAIHVRFVVADRHSALLRWRIDEGYSRSSDDFLIFEDAEFCESLAMFFEDLWQIGSKRNYAKD